MHMELTLVVQTGDDAGKRIPIPEGALQRIGRMAPAEVRISDDPMLSNLHFSLELSPDQCIIRDLGSRFGTLLNGHKVLEATLKDGDEIKAGRTLFQVRLAGGAPSSAQAPAADPARDTTTQREGVVLAEAEPAVAPANDGFSPLHTQILAHLRAQRTPLFAILDAAREQSITDRLKSSGQEHQSLYDGEKGQELAPYGPWLVRLQSTAPLLQDLIREGWGNSWGVFLTADLSLAEVRKHLRKFLMAKLPDGRQVYFRYYDPRVLRTYIPTCNPEEITSFFGPIQRYILESPDPAEVMEFSATYKDWRKINLAAADPVTA